MKSQTNIRNLCLSAMFLALAFVLPFLTGQIPEIGNMLCPMHIPAILCGFICGGPWGAVVGFIAPLLRSLILGAPALFPKAVAMSFELCAYGLFSGLLYRTLPKKKMYIYVSLVLSMIGGRLIWGIAQFTFMGLGASEFNLSMFWANAVINAVPGIIVQLILIPILIMLAERIESSSRKIFSIIIPPL